MIIAPSILSMDYSDTKEQMKQVNESKAQWVHFDVMDGSFVPNITFGPDILKGLKKLSDKVMDVHLMIDNPQFFADKFIEQGANQITLHIESFENLDALKEFIQYLKAKKVMVGLTSKPATSLEWIDACVEDIDTILVMSVEPGFGGQAFMPEALDKIKHFSELCRKKNIERYIQVDGGINEKTALECKAAGANVLVAGSYIFKGDIIEKVDSLI